MVSLFFILFFLSDGPQLTTEPRTAWLYCTCTIRGISWLTYKWVGLLYLVADNFFSYHMTPTEKTEGRRFVKMVIIIY